MDFLSFLQSGFAALLNNSIDFPRTKPRNEYDLKGRSNMWPNLLGETCRSCCVPCAEVDEKDKKLWILVKRRNDIAHGKDTPVQDEDEYDAFEEHVLDVMEGVAKAVNDALIKCKYLQPAVKQQSTAHIAARLHRQSGGSELANWFEAERRLSEGEKP